MQTQVLLLTLHNPKNLRLFWHSAWSVSRQQSLVQYLQAREGEYQQKVTKPFNEGLKTAKNLIEKSRWDGFIWPFGK